MLSYKIVRLRGIHSDNYIKKLYRTNPNLKYQSYQMQHDVFTKENITYPTGFSASMNKLGNESYEIYYDCEILQKQWAKENALHYDHNNWQTEIILAQLRSLQPDVLFFQDIYSMPPEIRTNIKVLVPSIKLKVIHKGYPGETRDLSDGDILSVSSPILFYRYKELRPHLIYHSFDDSILTQLNNQQYIPIQKPIDFSFFGNVRPLERRYWMIRKLLELTNIHVWGYEPAIKEKINLNRKLTIKKVLRSNVKKILMILNDTGISTLKSVNFVPKKLKTLIQEVDDSLKEHNKEINYRLDTDYPVNKTLKEIYPDRCHEPVYGIEYHNLLHNSGIVFNMHSSAAKNTVDNMKMFEITGVGSCLITDTGSNMQDIFEPDKEVVTYSSVDEALEKVNYLLDHPDEAQQIAKAGQARTLRDHTIMNRCEQIDEVIKKHLA